MPRTPQHNAGSERGMRDLKEETLLGKGVLVLDSDEAPRSLGGESLACRSAKS